MHPDAVQVIRHDVAGVSLRDGVEIQHFLLLAGGQGGGDARRVGEAVGGEAEAPDVEERAGRHVEGAAGQRAVPLRQGADLAEEAVGDDLLARVVAGEQGILVVARQAEVDRVEDGVDPLLDLLRGDFDPLEVGLDGIGATLGIARESVVPAALASGQDADGQKDGEKYPVFHLFGKVFAQS